MAEDQTKVEVLHDGEDTVVNILHKDAEDHTPTLKENTVANNEITLNLKDVVVKSKVSYVELPSGTFTGIDKGEIQVENVGDDYLSVILPCGDQISFKAEVVIAALLRACDLPVVEN